LVDLGGSRIQGSTPVTVKIGVVGSAGVGKSGIIRTYIEGKFTEEWDVQPSRLSNPLFLN